MEGLEDCMARCDRAEVIVRAARLQTLLTGSEVTNVPVEVTHLVSGFTVVGKARFVSAQTAFLKSLLSMRSRKS